MKLSIILPVYNGMPFLPDAVKSLLDQTFQDFIIYAIDNGSTDGSEEYLTGLNDRRLKYVRLEEKDLVKALNKGLELSETPLIARMDSDDISLTNRFQMQIDFLEKNPGIGLIGSCGVYLSSDGKKQFNINVPSNHQDIIATMLKSRNAILHPSIMFRREIVTKYGGFSDIYPDCEDYEFFMRIGKNIRFANLKERLHCMRIREGSIISDNIKRSLTQYYLISQTYALQYSEKYKDIKSEGKAYLNLYQKMDVVSMSFYRKGLNYYLNKKALIGLLYFAIASLTNPLRFLRSIKMKVKSKLVPK